MHTDALMQGLLSGLSLGATYALIAMGLSLFHSSSNILNMAHGSVVMLVGYVLSSIFGRSGNAWISIPTGILLGVVISLTIYLVFIRPVSNRSIVMVITITIFVLFIASGLAQVIWGSDSKIIAPISDRQFHIFGGVMSGHQIWVIGIVIIVSTLLALFFHNTLIGRSLRAVADNPAGAAAVGINKNTILMIAVIISGALAGLAAALVVPDIGVSPESGGRFTLLAAASAAIGGVSNIWGALIGGLILGIISGAVSGIAPTWFEVVQFGLLIVIFAIRPQGILGRKAVRKG
jgi:branched-chain amino acid transport system permease protein